jgi:hypothetical protein
MARDDRGHDVPVPDLLWDQVKRWFDPEVNGRLADVYVPDTAVADWQAVVDLVRSMGWAYEYSVDCRLTLLPTEVEDMLGRRDVAMVELRVWPTPDVQVIFWPSSVEQIDFDVDMLELQGQPRLDVLCGFLHTIGRRLRKPVIMTPERSRDIALLGYDVAADRVVMFVEP